MASKAKVQTEQDFDLVVTVRLYGNGTADDAAQVMNSYTGTFVLPNGDEAEIIGVAPLPDDAEISVPAGNLEKAKAAMKKAASG